MSNEFGDDYNDDINTWLGGRTCSVHLHSHQYCIVYEYCNKIPQLTPLIGLFV